MCPGQKKWKKGSSWSRKARPIWLDALGAWGESFMAACHLQVTSNVFLSSQQLSRTRQEGPSKMPFVPGDFLWCFIVWCGYKQTKVEILTGNLFTLPVLHWNISTNVQCITIQNMCLRLCRKHIKFQGPSQSETIFQTEWNFENFMFIPEDSQGYKLKTFW